ncbi:MAG: aspartate--ammonia ligase [Eubacteriales bacterium]|nr:aspartate--ammonia ligase [Eubacteriales bacterium]
MYQSQLNLIQTEIAIKTIKDNFEKFLAGNLNLTRVSAPLFVLNDTGLNDNLNGVERPVSFDIKQTGKTAEVVHSLAKWKRYALHYYGFEVDSGLYTDMNAIRRDEICDEIHSLYVDQWDWERVISEKERNLDFLKEIVGKIYDAIYSTANVIESTYGLENFLPRQITFISSQELEDIYPDLEPKERENQLAKQLGAIFIIGIGNNLKSGKPHDNRAPDYDDWALNGDLIVWYPVLNRSVELSSMGIRVNKEAMLYQLGILGANDRLELPFHKALMNDELPLTIGGGIGQSRLCMVLLHKAHIGEVQNSIWPDEMVEECKNKNIFLL